MTAGETSIRDRLHEILTSYLEDKAGKSPQETSPSRMALIEARDRFSGSAPMVARPHLDVSASTTGSEWAHVPWIAFAERRASGRAASGATVMLLFRADMSGVYLALMQGVGEKRAARDGGAALEKLRPEMAALEARGFRAGGALALRDEDLIKSKARIKYENAAVVHKLYEAAALPDDGALLADLAAVLAAYDRLGAAPPRAAFGRLEALNALIEAIAARGYVFEPWHVAAYVTALRTKPFVILAGVSGTGKSALPALVAELTGGEATPLPVRPDWSDSSDVLGYTDLGGRFRPGLLLELAAAAAKDPDRYHVCIVDEMNLARVEHYFAEVLSRIEDRREAPGGGFASKPLLSQSLARADAHWAKVGLPGNLAVVGTVNMDETTHGFSRKVLDRAFSLEISDIDLSLWRPGTMRRRAPADPVAAPAAPAAPQAWPARAFQPRALRLGTLAPTGDEDKMLDHAIAALSEVNEILGRAQLQVAYRVRDEVALFVVHAEEVRPAFETRHGVKVDPLDLALLMKILPRLAGGSAGLREVVTALFGWASEEGKPWAHEDEAAPALKAWQGAGRPASIPGARYPRTAARLALMHERLLAEGFTSFWM